MFVEQALLWVRKNPGAGPCLGALRQQLARDTSLTENERQQYFNLLDVDPGDR